MIKQTVWQSATANLKTELKIEITLEIKAGYYFEFLTLETMKLLRGTEEKRIKNKYSEIYLI